MNMNNLCGLNTRLNNNIDINPDFDKIPSLTCNHNFLPILHTLFEDMPIYILKYTLFIWKQNYNKLKSTIINLFLKQKYIKNIPIYEINKNSQKFLYIGEANIFLNTIKNNNHFIADLQRVYSFILPDGMENINIEFQIFNFSHSENINNHRQAIGVPLGRSFQGHIDYKYAIIGINFKGELTMYSHIIDSELN